LFANTGSPSIRVIVFGHAWPEWTAALREKSVWQGVNGIAEVLLNVGAARDIRRNSAWRSADRTIIVPLAEEHINACPPGFWSLKPDRLAVETFADKLLFADYVERQGLAGLSPTTYRSPDAVQFPCVLKRVDLYGGFGIEIARSRRHLETLLADEMWQGKKFVLQSLVAGLREYVTNCVCKNGRILWQTSFAYAMERDGDIRRGADPTKIGAFAPSPQIIDAIERFLLPLRYDGPCNVNYKLDDTGAVIVFEINPRFGGSLMMPRYAHHLRAALSCLVENARPG
jgi:hypothetical protein